MLHADPWDEVPRLEELLEAELLAQIRHSELGASAELFCNERCRVDDRCPLQGAIHSRLECPLWSFVRLMPL